MILKTTISTRIPTKVVKHDDDFDYVTVSDDDFLDDEEDEEEEV